MAEKKTRDMNKNAPEEVKFRLTCMNLGKGKEIEGIDVSKNSIDTNSTNFLEGKGAEKNEKGQLVLKVSNHRTESEIVKGNKIVHRRIGENGEVLYENPNLVKDEVR